MIQDVILSENRRPGLPQMKARISATDCILLHHVRKLYSKLGLLQYEKRATKTFEKYFNTSQKNYVTGKYVAGTPIIIAKFSCFRSGRYGLKIRRNKQTETNLL